MEPMRGVAGFLLLLASCTACAATAATVPFATLAKGLASGVGQPIQIVARSQTDWAALWSRRRLGGRGPSRATACGAHDRLNGAPRRAGPQPRDRLRRALPPDRLRPAREGRALCATRARAKGQTMKFGLHSVNLHTCGYPDAAARIGRAAEAAGFESLWVADHVVLPDPPVAGRPMAPDMRLLDPIVSLTFLAAHTQRIRLATGVIILPQRQALVLAKQLASLDV